jgi:hypothetical protein
LSAHVPKVAHSPFVALQAVHPVETHAELAHSPPEQLLPQLSTQLALHDPSGVQPASVPASKVSSGTHSSSPSSPWQV